MLFRFNWVPCFVALGAFVSLVPGSSLAAGRAFLEVGGGAALMQGGGRFFGTPEGDSFSIGPAFALTFGLAMSNPHRSSLAQFALQHRISTGTTGGRSVGLQATYPMVRFEVLRFFLSVGATPFVWRKVADSGYLRRVGHIGFLGEFGYHWPITPEVSLGGLAAGQGVMSGGAISPTPSYEGMVFFRFFFSRDKSLDREDLGPYKGWRYPYGIEIN